MDSPIPIIKDNNYLYRKDEILCKLPNGNIEYVKYVEHTDCEAIEPKIGNQHFEHYDSAESYQCEDADCLDYVTESPIRADYLPDRNTGTISTENGQRSRKKWAVNAIKCLLSVYKDHKNLFFNSPMKADEIWEKIKNEMEQLGHRFDRNQIRNKFGKLKSLFVKAKDNNRKTGAAPMNFSYMDEFEEIFGGSHFVTPVAIASSSRKNLFPPDTENSDMEDNESENLEINTNIPKKKRYTATQAVINKMEQLTAKKEERQIERDRQQQANHREIVSLLRDGNDILRNIASRLLEM